MTVSVVDGPENLYLVEEPSDGTVMTIVQDGTAAKLCCMPSKAIVVGLTEQPLKVPIPAGAPPATAMVICSVTEGDNVNGLEAVFPLASVPVIV